MHRAKHICLINYEEQKCESDNLPKLYIKRGAGGGECHLLHTVQQYFLCDRHALCLLLHYRPVGRQS